MTDPEWFARAACRDQPTDLFFPHSGQDAGPAKAICAGCSERVPCLEAALRQRELHGVFGGLTEKERRAIRRRRRLGRIA